MSKIKALAVVAHGDDETLWMGATLLRLDYDWTVCCILEKDKKKAKAFKRVCKEIYGAKPLYSLRKINPTDYAVVYTHSANGELRKHPDHIKVHNIVREMGFRKIRLFWPFSGAMFHTKVNENERVKKVKAMEQYVGCKNVSKKHVMLAIMTNYEGFLECR